MWVQTWPIRFDCNIFNDWHAFDIGYVCIDVMTSVGAVIRQYHILAKHNTLIFVEFSVFHSNVAQILYCVQIFEKMNTCVVDTRFCTSYFVLFDIVILLCKADHLETKILKYLWNIIHQVKCNNVMAYLARYFVWN